MRRPPLLAPALAGMALAALSPWAQATDFPNRPIRLVVPYAAGGPTDQFARAMADGMARELKQPVVVDNRPGAAAMVGTQAVARAPRDGYTIVLATTTTMSLNPMLYKNVTYAASDFKIFSVGVQAPLVVVTNERTPARNIAELAALGKSKPGTLNYSSVGLGTTLQLATEMLIGELGIAVTHIPYNGSAPALSALLANDVQLMIDVVSSALPHIKGGKVRALAVTSPTRVEVLPDVPTVAESGYPQFQASTWFGLAAPAQTPDDVLKALQAAADRTIQAPGFRSNFAALGLQIESPRSWAEIDRYVEADKERWGRVIRARSIRLD